jgi:hypothetical protein
LNGKERESEVGEIKRDKEVIVKRKRRAMGDREEARIIRRAKKMRSKEGEGEK